MEWVGGVDPDPAVHVLSGGGDPGAGFGGPELRDACRTVCGPSLRDQPGRVPGGPADRLQVDETVGHPLLDRLEAADRAAELLTASGVLGGHSQCAVRYANLDRTQADQGAGVKRFDQLIAVKLVRIDGDTGAVQEHIGV